MPPAFAQSAAVFAAVAPAKTGPEKASARVIAKVAIRIFMGFSPLRWTEPPQMNVFCGATFQEHPIRLRVESLPDNHWLGSEGIGKQAETFGLFAFRNIPSLCPAIMLGSILLLGGIILLLEPRKKTDAETLAEIRKALERGDEFTNGNRPEHDRG